MLCDYALYKFRIDINIDMHSLNLAEYSKSGMGDSFFYARRGAVPLFSAINCNLHVGLFIGSLLFLTRFPRK